MRRIHALSALHSLYLLPASAWYSRSTRNMCTCTYGVVGTHRSCESRKLKMCWAPQIIYFAQLESGSSRHQNSPLKQSLTATNNADDIRISNNSTSSAHSGNQIFLRQMDVFNSTNMPIFSNSGIMIRSFIDSEREIGYHSSLTSLKARPPRATTNALLWWQKGRPQHTSTTAMSITRKICMCMRCCAGHMTTSNSFLN